jgi:hypothetical protein
MENRIQRKKNKIYVALEMKDTFILSPSLNIGRFNFFSNFDHSFYSKQNL